MPDKVSRAGNGYFVALNNGYGFGQGETWAAPTKTINKGDSTSVGLGISRNNPGQTTVFLQQN